MAKTRALGRGISALIPSRPLNKPTYFKCRLERIRPMHSQPRQTFEDEALKELARSIESNGVLQPVLVRRDGANYVLIAGERRWRAAKIAGLHEIPAVEKNATDAAAYAMALVENIQREDLSPLEMAHACQRMIADYDHTQESLARMLGKSRSAIANTLRLLKLDESSKDALSEGKLSEGHARQLVGLDSEEQREMIDTIIEEGLSVRETERLVRASRRDSSPAKKRGDGGVRGEESGSQAAQEPTTQHVALSRALADLSVQLGMQVAVRDVKAGKGVLEIRFASYAQLESLVQRFQVAAREQS